MKEEEEFELEAGKEAEFLDQSTDRTMALSEEILMHGLELSPGRKKT